jgi:hypothetical protein
MPKLLAFNDFGPGSVLKIFHFTTLNKFRKLFVITGICTRYNKRAQTFTLSVYHGKELVKYDFTFAAPNIVWAEVLTSYNLERTIKNIHHYTPIKVHARGDKILAKDFIYRADPYDFLYRTRLTLAHKSRLRRKFRV